MPTHHTSPNQASLFQFNAPPHADRLIKLRDVEHQLSEVFHRESRPSRNTIIGWIEEGTLIGKQLGKGNNYYVFESSLESFKRNLVADALAYAA